MTVKEYLNKLTLLKQKANQKEEELKLVKKENSIYNHAGSGAGNVQTSFRRTGSRTEQQAVRWVNLESEVSDSVLTYLEERNRMINRIHELDDIKYIDILHRRYVDEVSNFENIAEDMGYSYQYILNSHAQALKAFEHKFPELF